MIQIIFLFFGILAIIYLIIINKPLYDNNKYMIRTSNIYPIDIQPIDIQPINLNKKKSLFKNNKKRKQKTKT